jgi:hypothetical protein
VTTIVAFFLGAGFGAALGFMAGAIIAAGR